MANDEEYIVSKFKYYVLNSQTQITYYEMNTHEVDTFKTRIKNIERNMNPNVFPDYTGEYMDLEVFDVSSSKESKSKGSLHFRDYQASKKRLEEKLKLSGYYNETFEYKDHSHGYWINSLKRNIKNHKESLLKYDAHGKKISFLARYTQMVLSYKDENGVEQWHSLGVDRIAMQLISEELDGFVDYFILFNDINSEGEVIPVKMIPVFLNDHLLSSFDFYPRKGAGIIHIGISEEF